MEVQGTQYGEEAELSRAQDVVPAGPAVTGPQVVVGANAVPNLSAPTERPDEPVTSGAPRGPGNGPSMANSVPALSPTVVLLRSMYQQSQSPHIRRMLDRAEGRG
jgi:hypothetical protein